MPEAFFTLGPAPASKLFTSGRGRKTRDGGRRRVSASIRCSAPLNAFWSLCQSRGCISGAYMSFRHPCPHKHDHSCGDAYKCCSRPAARWPGPRACTDALTPFGSPRSSANAYLSACRPSTIARTLARHVTDAVDQRGLAFTRTATKEDLLIRVLRRLSYHSFFNLGGC